MAFYRSIALLLGLLSLLLFSEGATIAWDAGGTPNNDWSIGQNWSTDALPANTDDVNFSASSGTILTSGNRIVNNFTLSSGSQILLKGGASGTDTLKINGGSITFQGAAHVLGATGANALGIVLGANTTLYVTTGGPQPSISGVISESGGSFKLIKDATSNATLFLQAANTFTGGVDINQGNLAITNSQALGTGTVTMASSTVLAWATATAPSSSVANNITFSGTSAILGFQGSNNGGMTLNFSGNLTSNVALTSNLTFTAGSNAASNQAEGTVMLSGNNSGLSQATNVYAISRYNLILSGANAAPGAGSFSMGSSAAANYFTRLLLDNSASSSNNITVTNGGAGAVAVDTIGGINTSGTTTFSGTITTNDSTAGKTFLTAATGGETDFTGKITDGASTIDIEKMGGGTVKLSNATSDYNGKTIVRAGTLIASGNAPVSSNSVIGNAASAIQLGDTRPSLSTVRVATTVMGTIFTGFSYTGTNQIVFTTGPTTIDGVALANGDRILMKDAPNPAANGIWVRTSQNQWDRATDMDTNGEVLYGMQISVTSGTLYGGNTFWLTTSTAPTINTTNLYFEADTLDPNVAFLTDGANTIARDLTVVANNSSGTSTIGGTNTSGIALLSGAVTLNRDLQLTAASGGRVNFTGILDDTAGSFSVTKINGGTVALTNANTYDGGTTVSAGTLLANNSSGSATGTGAVTIASGATLGGTGIIVPTGSNGLTVNAGGHLAPGDGGVGTLTVNLGSTTGTTNFASGSTFALDLAAPGTSDLVAFTGTSASDVAFNSNAVTLTDVGGAASGTYTIFTFDAASAYTGTLGTINGDFVGSWIYNTNSIQLTLTSLVSSNNTSALVISQNITGTSNVSQTGTGSTTLTGTNTSTGTATVNSGTLTIGTSDGGNWAGNVIVNGGTLKGRGTISGSLTLNGGFYSPGNSPGIQNVGTFTVNPGSTHLVEIDGSTPGNGSGFHDQTISAGAVTLNGGTLQGSTLFSGSSGYVPPFGTKINFLQGSSITGTYTDYSFSSNPSNLSFMPEYRGTEVNLFSVPADWGVNVAGMNPNQTHVGKALQSFKPNQIDNRTTLSDREKIFNGLMRLDNNGIKSAYDQLSPERFTAMTSSVNQFSLIGNGGVSQRLNQIRQGDHGVSLNGLTLQTLDGDSDYEKLAMDQGTLLVTKKKTAGQTGFFVNTTGVYSQVDSDTKRVGFENRLEGVTAGVDREINQALTLGLFANQGYADTLIDGGGTLQTNTGKVGVYAGYHQNGFYLNSSLAGGVSSFESKRKIDFLGETAHGSTHGYDLSGQITSGVDFQTERWVWGPLTKINYGSQWIDRFHEKDSAARLQVDHQQANFVETALGMRTSRPFDYKGWKWIPEIHLLASHQWIESNRIRARFAAGGDSFSVYPENTGQEMVIPGTGLSVYFTENTSLSLTYEARVNTVSTSHQLDLGIQTRF